MHGLHAGLLQGAIDHAGRVQAYYAQAAAMGYDRDQADTALRETQGGRAGSSPTADDLARARRHLALTPLDLG